MDEQPQYPPPLERLFQMGEVEWGVEWQGTDPDYVGELGLTREHVSALSGDRSPSDGAGGFSR